MKILEEIVAAIRSALDFLFGSTTEPEWSREQVGAALDNAAIARDAEHLDWLHSIVDLLKVLEMDSSVKARTALAKELKVSPPDGTAATNVALHEAVVKAVAKHKIVLPFERKPA
jgi:hypothetical protein